MGTVRATRSSIAGITPDIIIGRSFGKRMGNIGFMISRDPGILPVTLIIFPIPRGIASRSSGHMVPINRANPPGVISTIIASDTAH